MNMPFSKPELFAPCFQMLSIDTETIATYSNNVQFAFAIGNYSIDCEIKGVEVIDSIDVESQFDPEGGCEVNYTKLEVDNKTLVLVTHSDFEETPQGLHFILTDSQVTELNQWLQADAIEQLECAA